MLPTIEEIAVKTIVSIDINSPLKDAIIRMASSNHRNIVVVEKLESLSPKENKKEEQQNNDIDPRWENLKKLLTDK